MSYSNGDGDSDWLLSSDDEAVPTTSRTTALPIGSGSASKVSAPAARVPTMGERDWTRIASKFEDEGYREGITKGKQDTLQAGFDEGFNVVGASLGRMVGNLRGEATALLAILISTSSEAPASKPTIGRGMARLLKPKSTDATTKVQEEHSRRAQELIPQIRALVGDLNRVRLRDIMPPDYEAQLHDAEHAAEETGVTPKVTRETPEQTQEREAMLPRLEARLSEIREAAQSINSV